MRGIWDWLSGMLRLKNNKIELVVRHANLTAYLFRFNQIITENDLFIEDKTLGNLMTNALRQYKEHE